METVLKRISDFIFLYYRTIIVVFACLTVISLIAVFNMEIKTDILDVLPEGNKTVTQFRNFMEQYGASDNITVILETGNNSIEDHIDLIETFADKLKHSPLIEYVDFNILQNTGASANTPMVKYFPLYLDERGLKDLRERLSPDGIVRQIRLNRQRILSPFGSPVDSELISRDPLKISDVVAGSFKRAHKDDALDPGTGFYLTKDHSTAFIFAKPKGKSRDMAFVKELKIEMDHVMQTALKESGNPQDVKIQFAGAHILSEEVRQVIRHDIISSTVLSVVLIALLIWMAYRVRGIILAAVGFTMLASLLMTLAFAYIAFGSMNIVTSIVAAVLIGLYVDYSINMIKRYGDELRKNNDRQKALEITLAKAGSAIIISAATTSLSFFSILVTRFEGLHELGIVSGIGVLLCLISNIFLMSSLLLWASKGDAQKILSVKEPSLGIEGLITLVTKNPRHVLFAGIILAVLLGFGLTKLRFDNNTEHIGVKDSQAVEAIKVLNRKMNKKGDPLCLIVKGRNFDGLTYEFDSMEKLLSGWEKDGLIGRHDSLSVLLPAPYMQKIKIDALKKIAFNNASELEIVLTGALGKNGFAYDKAYINSYLSNILKAVNNREVIGLKELETVSDRKINLFFNKKDLSLAAYLYPPDMEWDKSSLSVIKTAASSEGRDWMLTGKSILFDEIKGSIIRGSTLAVAVTLLLNIIIVYWFYRKGAYVLLIMLPVTFGFLLTPGIMGYLNASFNFINIGTVALIFGFGVDYGIYVMQAYIKENERDVGNSLRIAGKNVMMCAATTVAGCGSLITGQFVGIATIGLVLTIGAILCAAIALIILPALLCLRRGK
jgi:predicted RND superfamily exporter protein